MRKLLCLLCVLVLLPVSCYALSRPDGMPLSLDFDFSFDMDPDAFPEEDHRTATGYAELLKRIRVYGTYMVAGNGTNFFDIDSNISITDKETVTIPIHLFGDGDEVFITSSLLGNECLYIFLDTVLYSALSIYDYFSIPAQQLALLIPYINDHALYYLRDIWKMYFPDGTNVSLSPEQMLQLVEDLQGLINKNDARLVYWIRAIGITSGFDSVIDEEIALLTDYVDIELPEGIEHEITGNVETWTSGEKNLCTHTADDTSETLIITLPETPEYGLKTDVYSQKKVDDTTEDISLTVKIASETEKWIDINVTGSKLPVGFPINQDFSISFSSSDILFGEMDCKVIGEVHDDEKLSLSFLLKQDEGSYKQAICLTGVLRQNSNSQNPMYDDAWRERAFVLTSLNESTLSQLSNAIIEPFIREMIPVLVQMPTISCQVILDQLSEHGVLLLLSTDFDFER